MARMPGATWRPVPNRTAGGQDSVRGVVLHIMEGTLDGTDSWFRNAKAQASSHFGVGKDGRIYQWVDTADRAWAQMSGNRTWLSIEHEGHSGDSLTPAQLAATARIVAWAHKEHGVPLVPTDSPTGRGIGWHGMGADAWGGHYDCPGTPIKAQRAAIIAAAKGGGTPPEEVDMDATQAKQLQELHDVLVPYAGWNFHGKLGDGSQDPGDALSYLRGTNATVKATATQIAAQGATIATLVQLLSDAHDDVDTAQVVAAVQQAIENAVVKVDISVGDNTTTRES